MLGASLAALQTIVNQLLGGLGASVSHALDMCLLPDDPDGV